MQKKKKIVANEKAYNRHVFEKNNSQTERLFSFIIVCFSKSLNTIESFREIRKRKWLILRDFHHIFEDVIAARQKNLEPDLDYNSFLVELFSLVISSQFSRELTRGSFNDIDFLNLEVRSFFSLNKFVSLEQSLSKSFVNSSKILSFRSQSFRSYERKHQNDFFIWNNAIEKLFRISNMTKKNEKSTSSIDDKTHDNIA